MGKLKGAFVNSGSIAVQSVYGDRNIERLKTLCNLKEGIFKAEDVENGKL